MLLKFNEFIRIDRLIKLEVFYVDASERIHCTLSPVLNLGSDKRMLGRSLVADQSGNRVPEHTTAPRDDRPEETRGAEGSQLDRRHAARASGRCNRARSDTGRELVALPP
tara:strand:- start:328 stop:657 length:330 start_codon:yes stop_codon:yes gene_type:complete